MDGELATTLQGFPVLTIVDIGGDASLGHIVSFLVANGKLRVRFDDGLARRSQLRINVGPIPRIPAINREDDASHRAASTTLIDVVTSVPPTGERSGLPS
jgi:hypothetical protein